MQSFSPGVMKRAEYLKQLVADKVFFGYFTDTDIVAANSFVVGEEIGFEGEVTNPRIQFNISQVPQHIRNCLLSHKAGETVLFYNDKWQFRIIEIYTRRIG